MKGLYLSSSDSSSSSDSDSDSSPSSSSSSSNASNRTIPIEFIDKSVEVNGIQSPRSKREEKGYTSAEHVPQSKPRVPILEFMDRANARPRPCPKSKKLAILPKENVPQYKNQRPDILNPTAEFPWNQRKTPLQNTLPKPYEAVSEKIANSSAYRIGKCPSPEPCIELPVLAIMEENTLDEVGPVQIPTELLQLDLGYVEDDVRIEFLHDLSRQYATMREASAQYSLRRLLHLNERLIRERIKDGAIDLESDDDKSELTGECFPVENYDPLMTVEYGLPTQTQDSKNSLTPVEYAQTSKLSSRRGLNVTKLYGGGYKCVGSGRVYIIPRARVQMPDIFHHLEPMFRPPKPLHSTDVFFNAYHRKILGNRVYRPKRVSPERKEPQPLTLMNETETQRAIRLAKQRYRGHEWDNPELDKNPPTKRITPKNPNPISEHVPVDNSKFYAKGSSKVVNCPLSLKRKFDKTGEDHASEKVRKISPSAAHSSKDRTSEKHASGKLLNITPIAAKSSKDRTDQHASEKVSEISPSAANGSKDGSSEKQASGKLNNISPIAVKTWKDRTDDQHVSQKVSEISPMVADSSEDRGFQNSKPVELTPLLNGETLAQRDIRIAKEKLFGPSQRGLISGIKFKVKPDSKSTKRNILHESPSILERTIQNNFDPTKGKQRVQPTNHSKALQTSVNPTENYSPLTPSPTLSASSTSGEQMEPEPRVASADTTNTTPTSAHIDPTLFISKPRRPITVPDEDLDEDVLNVCIELEGTGWEL